MDRNPLEERDKYICMYILIPIISLHIFIPVVKKRVHFNPFQLTPAVTKTFLSDQQSIIPISFQTFSSEAEVWGRGPRRQPQAHALQVTELFTFLFLVSE